MNTSPVVLSRNERRRLFGKIRLQGPWGASRRRTRRGAQQQVGYAAVAAAEVMEERALMSATFGMAVDIGNETGDSFAFGVATDAAGNSYVTGSFSGTCDFDQANSHAGDTDILTARGSGDIFIAKYAADSSLVWVTRMGGDAVASAGVTDVGRAVEVDASGNVYVAGSFRGTADFGSTVLSSSSLVDQDGFVTKFNSSGTIQWAKSWGIVGTGNAGDDTGNGVGIDSSGNVYAMGYRAGTGGGFDLLKFNSSGTAVWSKTIAASAGVSSSMTVDSSGNVFLAGSFTGTADFDPGPKTKNQSSGPSSASFAVELNSSGNFQWVSTFVGQTVGSTSGFSSAQSIALDGSGNVLVGGYYKYTVDFKPGGGVVNLPAVGGGYIAKLNSSGGLVWAKALESSTISSGGVRGLDTDSAGNVYATGSFSGTIDLNPGSGSDIRTSNGGADMYVVKLATSGNYSWAETFGGPGFISVFDLAVGPGNTLHLAGYLSDTVDFDPDPLSTYIVSTPGTTRHAYLLRLGQV
ncbi:MAG: hypothetical protein AB7I48_11215 [Planctomycetaceae bacterium]